MGFLSALFGGEKKEKQPEQKKTEPSSKSKSFPLGNFCFTDCPTSDPPELGYEGEIKWRDTGDEFDDNLGVYFDRDTPESDEADICYKKLEEYADNKELTESRVIREFTEHIMKERPDLISQYDDSKTPETAEELAEGMRLEYISIYRNGETVFSVNSAFKLELIDEDVHVTEKADGTVSFEYSEY